MAATTAKDLLSEPVPMSVRLEGPLVQQLKNGQTLSQVRQRRTKSPNSPLIRARAERRCRVVIGHHEMNKAGPAGKAGTGQMRSISNVLSNPAHHRTQ